MGIDLSRFKVVYGDKVLNALSLMNVQRKPEDFTKNDEKLISKPKFIEVMAINEDGNIIIINDEAWCFQFLPIVSNN